MACQQNHTASLLCLKASGSSHQVKRFFYEEETYERLTGPSPRAITNNSINHCAAQ